MNLYPYKREISYERPDDAERLYTIDELRNLKPGDKVILNSTEAYDIWAIYDGTVVDVCTHHIVLSILIRPESTAFGVLGEPIPYTFSIPYVDNGKTNYIWKPLETAEVSYGN